MAIHGGIYLTLSVLGLPAASSGFLVAVPSPPLPVGPAARLELYRDGGSFVGGEHDSSSPRLDEGTSRSSVSAGPAGYDDENDAAGATLGDIMAGPLVPTPGDATRSSASPGGDGPPPRSSASAADGLVTRDGGDISARFPDCAFRPMERVALTANGNLQRVLSSYYDRHVTVDVESCVKRRQNAEMGGDFFSVAARAALERFDPAGGDCAMDNDYYCSGGDGATWDRIASIRVHDRTVCRATSVITVHSPECADLIEEGSVGLGQLFRYLDRLPTFRLLDAGRRGDAGDFASDFGEWSGEEGGREEGDGSKRRGMWRTYELRCEEVTCLIHEEFHEDTWDL